MAKKKATAKVKKEVEYVASGLQIDYSIPIGLTGMLASASKTSDKEVWCALSDMANICAVRLIPRLGNRSYGADSWTTQTFPGSTVKLRLDMKGYKQSQRYDPATRSYIQLENPKMHFTCRIKVSGTTTERFTQAMINDYITDKILLGDFEGLDDVDDTQESVDGTATVDSPAHIDSEET